MRDKTRYEFVQKLADKISIHIPGPQNWVIIMEDENGEFFDYMTAYNYTLKELKSKMEKYNFQVGVAAYYIMPQ